jgi:hypothetical protein
MLISLAAQTNAAVERTRHPDAAWRSGTSRLSRWLRVATGYPGLRIVLLVAPCSQPGPWRLCNHGKNACLPHGRKENAAGGDGRRSAGHQPLLQRLAQPGGRGKLNFRGSVRAGVAEISPITPAIVRPAAGSITAAAPAIPPPVTPLTAAASTTAPILTSATAASTTAPILTSATAAAPILAAATATTGASAAHPAATTSTTASASAASPSSATSLRQGEIRAQHR